ncbi:hypothetical protein, partial [Paenisporosarcina sp.]|uniref:hypothetical protein n=1 Tax=Paenisporosarcina sp. TaxID=1932001 RepID=UPI003C75499D
MEKKINHFVSFMQQYDLTTADYSKIFDEHTTNVQYNIDTNVNNEIIKILKETPKSIIITGNAGDGKTRICRNVYDELASDQFEHWSKEGIEEIQYENFKLKIVKDLSELRDEVILKELLILQDILEDKIKGTHYLIAANEGKLTHFLLKYPNLEKLRDVVIPQFSENAESDSNLKIFNLLHSSSSIYAKKIVDEWNKDENWEVCNRCLSKDYCVINDNYQSLSSKTTAVRLNRIYRSLDGNQGHMTMRELLIHLAYTFTGGLHCREVHSASPNELQTQSKKAYYENFFGHNLPKEVFEEITGVQELRAFDPGHISDSAIDDFILNGDLESNDLSEMHKGLFGDNIDTEYGYFYQELREYRLNYRSDEDAGKKLAKKWLPRLRRKYYFESREKDSIEKLVPYRYRKLFLDILKSPNKLDLEIKKELIDGLNVYFSKKMVYSPSNALYVTSENLFVYEVINFSDVKFDIPSDNPNVDQKNSYFVLKVDDRELKVNLLTFEYLIRLANGGLFNVLKEDVEILLNNFRNQLITNKNTKSSILRILKFNGSIGAFVLKEIQIQDAVKPIGT